MKRKSNNSGRQVRSQEEIEARREARRKYYEEMEAFERDLPDFIFADEQTDSREELTEEFDANTHNNIEENENHEDFGSGKASGAVFAVMGGMIYVIIRHRGRVADLTVRQMLIMAAFSLYFGFASEGVDNVAHIGGLLSGFLIAVILYHPRKTWKIVP